MLCNWLKYNTNKLSFITPKIASQLRLKMVEYRKIRKQKDRRRRRQGEKYANF